MASARMTPGNLEDCPSHAGHFVNMVATKAASRRSMPTRIVEVDHQC
jgi:hypothetical protein